MGDSASGTAAVAFSAQMKEGCWDLHQAAESAELPKRLVKGEVTRDEYRVLVEQSLLLMRRLDEAIVRRRGEVGALGLIDDEQLQGPRLEADLEALGGAGGGVGAGSIEPLAETRAAMDLVDRVERDDPLALLGLHYVREGANNGNRFVAMKVGPALGLEGGAGLSHLDPYGESQRPKWEAFKAGWDGLGLDEDERLRVVAAGRAMFEAITGLHRGVMRACSSS